MPANPIDIFLHVHKTGGMSLTELLRDIYPANRIYLINGERYERAAAEFADLPQHERDAYALLKGHMFFGYHRHLTRPARYFSMLRDPRKRLISLYNYLYNHRLYPQIQADNLSFEQFLSLGIYPTADNGLARFIAGIDYQALPYGQTNEEVVSVAKANIDRHFTFIGRIDRYDESLLLMKELLGWPTDPVYDRINRSKTKEITVADVDFESSEILPYWRYDQEVYTYAMRKFEPLYTRYADMLERELPRFRAANEAYQTDKGRLLVKRLKLLAGQLLAKL